MKKKEYNNMLKKMSVQELQKEYDKKHNELMKIETKMRKEGSSTLVRNYPSSKKTENMGYGNVSNIKRDIARIKTFLCIKHGVV